MFFFIILCNICVQVIAWNNKTQPTYKFGIKSKCSLLNVDRSGPNIHHFCRVIVGRGRKGYTVFPAWKKETGLLKPGLSLSRRRSVYCNYTVVYTAYEPIMQISFFFFSNIFWNVLQNVKTIMCEKDTSMGDLLTEVLFPYSNWKLFLLWKI